eukprot:TRINITY_DN7652_c0_g1_i1.p1 TRINITY_DN7652_c0_g1~~TRINITY_DN7652_c0_g1_i1.p1  ORF type:complete len:773 (+),score=181.22 TRINITY_DN7652_c0_g1_i1:540-2858(+)
MLEKQPSGHQSYETLIEISEEDDAPEELKREVDDLFKKLIELFPQRSLSIIGKLKSTGVKTKEDIQALARAADSHPSYLTSWILLSQAQTSQSANKSALEIAEKGLLKLETRAKRNKAKLAAKRIELLLLKAESCQKLQNKGECVKAYQLILQLSKQPPVEALKALALIYSEEDNYPETLNMCTKLIELNPKDDWALSTYGWTLFRSHQSQSETVSISDEKVASAVDYLQRAKEINAEKYLYWHHLGLIYWTLGGTYKEDRKYALHHFLQSAKWNPSFAPNFTYLGQFYQEIEKDLEKAKRCYQKAISLDPLDTVASKQLSEMYLESGQVALAESILRQITNQKPREHWAFLRLGLLQLKRNDHSDAVTSFQSALRTDPKSITAWQALAESYLHLAKFMAAMKAFARTVELDPTNVYSIYQLATIKNLLKMHEEAIQDFENLLKSSSDYLPAFKGLGDAHLALARQASMNGDYKQASHHLQQGELYASKCLSSSDGGNQLQCVYKLLADLHLCYSQTPLPDYKTKQEILKHRVEHLDKAASNLRQAIDIQPSIASIYYDLGITNYHRLLTYSASNKQETKKFRNKAAVNFKKAITLEPHNSMFWIALGVVEERPSLKQHAFIRAIQLDSRNSVAWNNLGILYRTNKQDDLAVQAFALAQAINPDDPAAWIGKALMGEINVEAAQIISQTTLFGLSFAAFVVGNVNVALRCVEKALEQNKEHAGGHRLLALIQREMGKKAEAEASLKVAAQLEEQQAAAANATTAANNEAIST